MPTYDDAFIRERASSGGKDPGRMRYAEGLATRARSGDQAALEELLWRSGVAPDPDPTDKEGAWATADARNFGKMLARDLTGQSFGYDEANDGSFKLGKALGDVLRIGAPIAGAFIPGVGMLGAAAIGGLGNAAGNLASGRGFNLQESLLAAGGAAAGNRLLGNGLGSGTTNLGFGSTPAGAAPIPGTAPSSGAGNVTQGGYGGGAPAGGGGAIDPLHRYGEIGSKIQKYAPLVLGGLGAVNHAAAQSGANRSRDAAIGMATADWQSRAPIRSEAIRRAMAPLPGRENLSAVFDDPTDPYRRPPSRVPLAAALN